MKKIFLILIIMLVAFNSKSQQITSETKILTNDYFKKSKKQRNTGFILLGSGVAMFTGGYIAMQHSQSKGENEFFFLVGGLATTTASLPFFISARISKHKAKVYIKRDAYMITPGKQSNISYSSLNFRINL
ncbi:MAG TPA: hypothetical protein VFP97_02755 [Chitinophagaceae bacterium]|nr:hypothetical protein [Chitinophagaceae bacterium]